jgi:hypothetical protein
MPRHSPIHSPSAALEALWIGGRRVAWRRVFDRLTGAHAMSRVG